MEGSNLPVSNDWKIVLRDKRSLDSAQKNQRPPPGLELPPVVVLV